MFPPPALVPEVVTLGGLRSGELSCPVFASLTLILGGGSLPCVLASPTDPTKVLIVQSFHLLPVQTEW